MDKKIWEKVKGLKKDQWMIIVLVGILLIVVALPTGKKKSEEGGDEENVSGYISGNTEGDADIASAASREEELEERLEKLLSSMDGVGRVKVMVNLEGSTEYVVEKDSKERRTENVEGTGENEQSSVEIQLEEETVFMEKEDGNSPYVVQEKYPEIKGVVVLAEGGGNAVVAENISKAVEALFSIETHKIMVMKMEYSGG